MDLTGKELKTKNYNVHFGDREWLGNKPVAKVKAGKRVDFLTIEDFAEALYGFPVKRVDVHFKDE